MTPAAELAELINTIAERRIRLAFECTDEKRVRAWPDGRTIPEELLRLRYEAPEGAMTADVLQALRRWKRALWRLYGPERMPPEWQRAERAAALIRDIREATAKADEAVAWLRSFPTEPPPREGRAAA